MPEQGLASRSEDVAGLPLFEERIAENALERGYPAGDGRLAGPKSSTRRERAAFPSNGDEISEVVPIEHRGRV